MPASERALPSDKYWRERRACDRELTYALRQTSAGIADPVLKLRYLQRAVGADSHERIVRHVPCAPARRAWYRWRGLAALNALAHNAAAQIAGTFSTAYSASGYRWPAIVAALAFVPILVAGMAFGIGTKSRTDVPLATSVTPVVPGLPASRSLPESPMPANPGQGPGTIWLADRGQGWELYSNGLRVETTYAIAGEPRRYRIHDRTAGLQPTLYARPVGILFHTSESDLWPLEPGYRKQLRRSTAGLLKYLRANQSYNYLIDRFGRVYRIVDDDSRASHAGSSVWARGDEVYLDLNAAFLGISFESRWEGGRSLPITAAQVQAGRELTDYLRQRFAIAPEMCVTHGLASVSPRQHLIGYHLDWARGFPFAAFGLPDMYAEPTPSIVLFGFGYDERFLRDVGERWPGLTAAEDALAQSAAERRISLAELRLEGRDRYRRWAGEVRTDPPAASR